MQQNILTSTNQNLLQRHLVLLEELSSKYQSAFFGAVKLGEEPTFHHFEKWLSEGKHAQMSYLERYKNFRKNPATLEPDLTSALIFGFNYYQGDRYEPLIKKTNHGFNHPKPREAQYARFKDYHRLLKAKGEAIMSDFFSELGLNAVPFRVLVDSAPVLERALASRSGQGFIGKNTLFIDPKRGSYFLLFEVLVDLSALRQKSYEGPIDGSKRISSSCVPCSASNAANAARTNKDPCHVPAVKASPKQSCGTCRRCSVRCPSGALDTPYILDARKCIAYYTIEHRGAIPVSFWKYLKLYYFGCDICQLVCPFNREAEVNESIHPSLPHEVTMLDVAIMDQKQYEEWFGGTPLTRAKISGLKRNALINLVVTNHPKLAEALSIISRQSPPDVLKETVAQIKEFEALAEII